MSCRRTKLFYRFSFESTWKQSFDSERSFLKTGSRVNKFQNTLVSVWMAKTQLFENDAVAPPPTSPMTRERPLPLLRVFDLNDVFSVSCFECGHVTAPPTGLEEFLRFHVEANISKNDAVSTRMLLVRTNKKMILEKCFSVDEGQIYKLHNY